MQLEEPFFELDSVKVRRWLPWLALFRAFRLAIRPRAIVLGCLALLLLDAGFVALSRFPFATPVLGTERFDRSEVVGSPRFAGARDIDDLGVTWFEVYSYPLRTVGQATGQPQLVLHPLSDHAIWAQQLFTNGGGVTAAATAITALLLCLIVWSICGVAIARMSAVKFAVDGAVGFREGFRYSFRKLGSSMGTVIVPMLAVLSLWFAGVVLGWLGNLPVVGGAIVGLGWGLALLAGLGMALILLGLAAGWPLMLASVAVEDADAFDSFGRVYNYVFARPWYALFLVVLMLLYGSILIVFVATLLNASSHLAVWSVNCGLGVLESTFALEAVETWRNIAGLVLHGFIVSYFWTATTLVYVLLRKSEDATPLDSVTLPFVKPPGDEDLPLVGMPAADKREAEASSGTDQTT